MINGVTFNTGYIYDQKNRITEFSRNHNTSYSVLCQLHTYDDLGRFTGYITQENFGNIVITTLGYKAPSSTHVDNLGVTATTVLSQLINTYGSKTKGYYYNYEGNGNSIYYDIIGNSLSDGTWDYTWEHGRQLESQSNGTTTWDVLMCEETIVNKPDLYR